MAANTARLLQGLPRYLINARSAFRLKSLCSPPTPRPVFQRSLVMSTARKASDEKNADEVEKKQKHVAALDANFEEDAEKASGKTTVNILNEEKEGIFFDAYSSAGFRLSNGMRVMGPCAVFPRSILHWNVKNVRDVTPATLRLFTILEPKIDILILGVGERENLKVLNPDIIRFMRENRVNVEVLSTDQALATFNFLNSEKRYVAAALIPPSYFEDERFDPDDSISARLENEEDVFLTRHDYDYVPPVHEAGLTDEMWEKRGQLAREKLKEMIGSGKGEGWQPPTPSPKNKS